MKRIYYKKIGDELDTKVAWVAYFEEIDKKNVKMDLRVMIYNVDGVIADRIMYDAEQIAGELKYEILDKKMDWNEYGEMLAGVIFRKVQVYSRRDYTKIIKEELEKLNEYFPLDIVLGGDEEW